MCLVHTDQRRCCIRKMCYNYAFTLSTLLSVNTSSGHVDIQFSYIVLGRSRSLNALSHSGDGGGVSGVGWGCRVIFNRRVEGVIR